MADLGAKIAKAKASGYSDAEITAFLGQDAALAPKIQQARSAGYKDADIVSHLSAASAPASSAPDRVASGGISGLITGKTQPKRSVLADISGAFASANRQIPLMDELAAGIGVGVDVAQGKVRSLDDVGKSWNQQRTAQREIEGSFDQAHPYVAALSRGTGMAAGVLAPGGATTRASVLAPRLANMARGAVAAGLTGGVYAASGEGTAQERLAAASKAVRDPIALGLGAAAGALSPALRRASRGVNADVATLNRAGVQMTPGQMRGGMSQAVEDAATSTPILGPAIQGARRRGLESFNRSVLNRSLEPIGEALPAGQVGQDAVRHAGDRLGAAYEGLAPSRVHLDDQFADAVRQGLANTDTMTPQGRETLANILQRRVTSRGVGGVLDDAAYRQIQSELGYEIRRFTGSPDPDNRAVAQALGHVRDALEDAAFRQNPEFAAQLGATNRGYAELVRAENAAARGRDGVFTANQYDAAVKAGDPRIRRRGYARGEALGQDISTAARNVLPSTVPDSGTATRGAIGAIITAPTVIGTGFATGGLSGGLGAAAAVAAPLAGLGLASRAYSPRAIAAANAALTRRINTQEQRAAMTELRNMAASDPRVQDLYNRIVRRLSNASGAARADQGIDLGDIDRSTNPQFLASQRARNVLATEGR